VIIFAAMLAIGSALYTVAHFAITTDTDRLLPQDLPWRQHEQAYRDAFPQDQILAVVEGPTPELVEMAADRLAAELRTRPDRFPSFSWRTLMSGHPAAPDELRGLIQIQPKLDFGALEPGRAAIDAIRQAADELKLGPRFGTRLRLTGQVAINDEQFVMLGKGMLPNLAGTVLAVLFILWLALRSPHTNLAVFVSLCVGFVVTAAAGLLMVGAFHMISIAFGILFIGLGADFCIQFAVRYRSERHEQDEVRAALRGAAARAGGPLALAAAGTMFGFFSFVPTAYRGIAEL